jgi:predicted ATPase
MRWLAMDRLNEAAYRRLMRLRFAAGDRTAALPAYEACRSILDTELAAQPAAETEALAQHIRSAAPPARDPRATEAPFPVVAVDAPLVGRAAEHGRLVAALRAVTRGGPRVVSIEGEPGIGKTRLTSEFLRWASAQGADVLHGRAFEVR